VAISDFFGLCETLNRAPSRLFGYGANYEQIITKYFLKYATDYISSLTSFIYYGNSLVYNYKLSKLEYFVKRLKAKIHKGNSGLKLQRVAKPDIQDFIYKTKIFINNIFSDFAEQNESNAIILDQAISAFSNPENSLKYFDDIKLIIVDRDPRDIYVELEKYKTLFVNYDEKLESVHNYIKWFKILRQHKLNIPQIKYIKFEELVNSYEEVLLQIASFLNIDISMHKNKFTHFRPQESKTNIGIWRDYNYPEGMELLSTELSEFCYS
jgi:hypothetical protein